MRRERFQISAVEEDMGRGGREVGARSSWSGRERTTGGERMHGTFQPTLRSGRGAAAPAAAAACAVSVPEAIGRESARRGI